MIAASLTATDAWLSSGSVCGHRTYNSRFSMCCAGRVVRKPFNGACCGTQAYDTRWKISCGGRVLTKPLNGACCGTQRYDYRWKICCGGRVLSRPLNGACCGTQAYDTSSPRFPQANGEAERAVRVLKEILRKNEEPHLALLTQRTTPLLNGLSPSQLLMGRRLRTRLPVIPSTLLPGVTGRDLHNAKAREAVQRAKQQQQFNSRHRANF